MRNIGICTSSRSERHLMEALLLEMTNGKYELYADFIEINSTFFTPLRNTSFDILREYDFLIIPADRTEMCRFAYDCFIHNIPFCHFLAGSQSYSYTHDDVNRWMISLMANFCFAESDLARDNLIKAGILEDRILITGTSHFDGVTIQDIEANKPKDAPNEIYDLILMNPTTQIKETCYPKRLEIIKKKQLGVPESHEGRIVYDIEPNEDEQDKWKNHKTLPRLEFLWLLKHCDNFISNSSATIYEVPYLNKYYDAKIKTINPSQRNKERTPISPEYCRGASKIISEWCEKVDLDWLRTPKRLFQTKSFPSGY